MMNKHGISSLEVNAISPLITKALDKSTVNVVIEG